MGNRSVNQRRPVGEEAEGWSLGESGAGEGTVVAASGGSCVLLSPCRHGAVLHLLLPHQHPGPIRVGKGRLVGLQVGPEETSA